MRISFGTFAKTAKGGGGGTRAPRYAADKYPRPKEKKNRQYNRRMNGKETWAGCLKEMRKADNWHTLYQSFCPFFLLKNSPLCQLNAPHFYSEGKIKFK